MMFGYNKLLAEVNQVYLSKNIDDLVYADYLIEYPIPDIAKDIDWKKILDKPSTNSSSRTRKELNFVIDQTKKRSKEDIKLIYQIDDNPNYIFNKFVQNSKLNFSYQYFKQFYNIVKPFIYNTKFYYNRLRPYNLAEIYNLDVNILQTSTHNTPSYPSGHVVYTNLAVNILIDDYPQYRKSLQKITQQTAQARISQGVHYPSDCEAGIKLSNYLFNILHPRLKRSS